MHCCNCGNTSIEVRPVFIGSEDVVPLIREGIHVPSGDVYVCQKCANEMAILCRDSVFVTWVGYPCDTCSRICAFNDDIDDLPTGIVCDECVSPLDLNAAFGDVERGTWLCEECFEASHQGHREKHLQPILDRLANL